MEPKLPSPNIGSERSATPSERKERPSGFSPLEMERRTVEKEPEPRDVSHARVEAVPIVPTVLPPPVIAEDVNSPQIDDTPLVANDDDLIEKEWVDKAKKIIATTKDDPYQRELEVGRLQADYLRKRYGKELGTPH